MDERELPTHRRVEKKLARRLPATARFVLPVPQHRPNLVLDSARNGASALLYGGQHVVQQRRTRARIRHIDPLGPDQDRKAVLTTSSIERQTVQTGVCQSIS
jgi:hypothetical protein